MNEMPVLKWLDAPEAHDYPAAQSYLELIFEAPIASKYVEAMRVAPMATFMAKDIFRASALSSLGVSNLRVQGDRQKIASGKALSPLLLVRDSRNGRVIVADGYHRLCAVYSYDEGASVPCKIV